MILPLLFLERVSKEYILIQKQINQVINKQTLQGKKMGVGTLTLKYFISDTLICHVTIRKKIIFLKYFKSEIKNKLRLSMLVQQRRNDCSSFWVMYIHSKGCAWAWLRHAVPGGARQVFEGVCACLEYSHPAELGAVFLVFLADKNHT